MKRENLFRIALITHSNAPETLNKYIILLSKVVVMESQATNYTSKDISKLIKIKFDLEFLDEEIICALGGDKNHAFQIIDKKYILKPEEIQNLKDAVRSTKTIEHYLSEFLRLFYSDKTLKEKNKIKEVIMQYIYYSFNAGKKSLASLLDLSDATFISEEFSASDTEKKIINEFLDWENLNKNECIYSIVSYCLDYGMLTSKKDAEAYRKVFAGLHFYLDSNIIFRLIGMNNLERQETIQHFINKCKEVEIELCYTNLTYQEVIHTINNTVKYVKYLNNGDRPLAPADLDKIGEYENQDFYDTYYQWCMKENNQFDNYNAYYDYLLQKVENCINEFTEIDIPNADYLGLKDELVNLSTGLMEYKNQRNTQRLCSFESAKTDANNFLHIKYSITTKSKGMIPSVKNFFISADRKFCNWAINVLPGVPTIFMPSEWLSIILKYTSRTDSDYNTFCKFMDFRLSRDEKQNERTMNVIQSINELTTDLEVKRKIINQVTALTLPMNDFNLDQDKKTVKKAFDTLLENERYASQSISKKFDDKEKEHKEELEKLKDKALLDIEKAKVTTLTDATRAIAKGIIDKKIRKWVWIKDNLLFTQITTAIISFIILFLLCKINFFENSIYTFCDTSKILKNNQFDFSLALSGAFSLIITGVGSLFVKYMGSDKRKEKILHVEEEKNQKMIAK